MFLRSTEGRFSPRDCSSAKDSTYMFAKQKVAMMIKTNQPPQRGPANGECLEMSAMYKARQPIHAWWKQLAKGVMISNMDCC